MPKVFFAADHAGFELKTALVEHVNMLGYEVIDLGAYVMNADDDYPDVVTELATRVAHDPLSRGVIVGGSGQGEAMCANRVKDVRAAVFYGVRKVTHTLEIEGSTSEDVYDVVRLARRHNDANVLSIGARFVPVHEADEALRIFLETPFSEAKRHVRRLAKF
jgi:ribose 5-phosphate isomerase B